MPPRWTPKREKLSRRRADGTFKEWPGGRKLADMAKKKNTQHGTRIHIGHWFSKWSEKAPQIGDHFRMRKPDGSFHAGATWYVYTPNGWRDTNAARKPSPQTIARLCASSRPSKGRR